MILFCGEAIIDMLPAGDDDDMVFRARCGGAAYNGAVALARLDAASGLLAGISADPFGQHIARSLADERVDRTHCMISARPTTLAFVLMRDGQTHFLFHDENSAGRMLEERQLPRIRDDARALVFSGISLAQEPSGSTLERLMQREKSRRLIVLDPNIRPAIVPDAAAHRARIRRLMTGADIVKVSDEDLAWMEMDIPALQELPAGLVFVTKGAAGALALTAGRSIVRPAKEVAVADTVGAGDSFLAAGLAWLDQHSKLDRKLLRNLDEHELAALLDFAQRAAAITVSRKGMEPPRAAEMA